MNPGEPPRVAVVLLAAGQSRRFGANQPKQFVDLAGQPVFTYSLQRFDRLAFVGQIALVVPPDGFPEEFRPWLDCIETPLVEVRGGTRRQDSVGNGLAALTESYEVAMVHDAARPFASPQAIEALAFVAREAGGGLLAQRCTDTVKQARDGQVERTLDRDSIWLAQTPQAIRADLVERAIEAFHDPTRNYTDEAALLEGWSIPVRLIESSAENFKITHVHDLLRAEALVNARKNEG